MRVCLLPLQTKARDPQANLERLHRWLPEISVYRPDLICLPECTLTGYLSTAEDLERFAEPVPGITTQAMAEVAREMEACLCFGLVEAGDGGAYSSAVLLDPQGRVVLVQRKIVEKPPYLSGTAIHTVRTSMGRLGVLVCGDLFDEELHKKLRSKTDFVLVPMARCFDGQSPDPARWEGEERQAYLDTVQKAGVMALLVNGLEDAADAPDGGCADFGGAMVVSATGELLAESPHGSEDFLIYDVPNLKKKKK
jgi:predicted amidohydrolase